MSTLGKVVSALSPIIGNVLNMVLPGSGLIISGLMALFGVKSNDQEELATTIASDPNAAVKLREFEIEHQDILAKMGQADTASARDMNIQTTKATGKTDYVMHMLAIGSFLGCGLYLAVSVFFPKQFDVNIWHDLLNFLMLIFSFYFGGMYKQSQFNTQHVVDLPPPAQTR
jgi:hypothetical protein